MMRLIASAALFVCSVANARWPVSAIVSAAWIVSRSRISPTRITSGSSRSAYLSALWNDFVSVPTSRWFTMQFWWRCTNSIGSSTVMMCPRRSLLILSIIAASVVDLPEPVGPVTSTRPRGFSAIFVTAGGSPSWSSCLIVNGIWRIATDTQPRCLNTLPRKRASCWMPNEKSSSSSISKRFFWLSVSTEYASAIVSRGVSTCSTLAFTMSPSTRSFGRSPAVRCRSLAPLETISSRSARRLSG